MLSVFVSIPVFICAGLFASLAVAAPIQWSSTSGGNDHWYELVFPDTGLDWYQARGAAESSVFGGASGYLVTITNTHENEFVKQAFYGALQPQSFSTGSDQNGDFAWIGLSDHVTEGVFQWVTGEGYSFNDFGPFEPSSLCCSSGPLQDFGLVRVLDDGRIGNGPTWQWDDNFNLPTVGVERLGYIVEYEGVVRASEPASALLIGLFCAGLARTRYRKA